MSHVMGRACGRRA